MNEWDASASAKKPANETPLPDTDSHDQQETVWSTLIVILLANDTSNEI